MDAACRTVSSLMGQSVLTMSDILFALFLVKINIKFHFSHIFIQIFHIFVNSIKGYDFKSSKKS